MRSTRYVAVLPAGVSLGVRQRSRRCRPGPHPGVEREFLAAQGLPARLEHEKGLQTVMRAPTREPEDPFTRAFSSCHPRWAGCQYMAPANCDRFYAEHSADLLHHTKRMQMLLSICTVGSP
jgi:hypothetical protein